jgi:hypothetical protein
MSINIDILSKVCYIYYVLFIKAPWQIVPIALTISPNNPALPQVVILQKPLHPPPLLRLGMVVME